jgi:hypothetical protein
MSRLLHSLTHRHFLGSKPGVGMVMGCTPRLRGRTRWLFAYAGDQPDWMPISTSVLDRITTCTSRHQVEQVLAFGGRA